MNVAQIETPTDSFSQARAGSTRHPADSGPYAHARATSRSRPGPQPKMFSPIMKKNTTTTPSPKRMRATVARCAHWSLPPRGPRESQLPGKKGQE